MFSVTKVVFDVADAAAEESLVRAYVTALFERLDARADAEWAVFNRYAHDPSMDHGEVIVHICGDTAITNDERSRWNRLTDRGLVDDWWADTVAEDVRELPYPERRQFRMRAVASRMSLECYDEFDELPDALTESGEEPTIGWDICLHHVINQLGYQAGDGDEEIDLLFESIRARLYAMAMSPAVTNDATQRRVDSLVEELEALSPALRDVHEDHRSE